MATPLSAPLSALQAVEPGSCGCGCSTAPDARATSEAESSPATSRPGIPAAGIPSAGISAAGNPISGDLTVREVLSAFPASVSVFHTYGIDTCCGAGASLRNAAVTAGADLDSILISLQAQFGGCVPGTNAH